MCSWCTGTRIISGFIGLRFTIALNMWLFNHIQIAIYFTYQSISSQSRHSNKSEVGFTSLWSLEIKITAKANNYCLFHFNWFSLTTRDVVGWTVEHRMRYAYVKCRRRTSAGLTKKTTKILPPLIHHHSVPKI